MEEARLGNAGRPLRCQHCGEVLGWHTLERLRVDMDAAHGVEMGNGTLFIQCQCGRWNLWQSEAEILRQSRW